MIFESNFHTHTSFCDGKNTPEEMAHAAYNLGIKTLGFSGHGYSSYDESYCMSKEGTLEYIRRVNELKEEYRGKMRILLGIERDFGCDEPEYKFDYTIGSVHAIFPKRSESVKQSFTGESDDFYGYDRSRFCVVDWSIERTQEDVSSFFENDPYSYIEAYYAQVSRLPEITHCDIIGHFDLITKFTEKESWFDINHPRYLKASDNAFEKLLSDDVIFEINTGAIARGFRTFPYPSTRILEKLGSSHTRVVINSDSHEKGTLTFWFKEAYELAKKYKLNIVTL